MQARESIIRNRQLQNDVDEQEQSNDESSISMDTEEDEEREDRDDDDESFLPDGDELSSEDRTIAQKSIDNKMVMVNGVSGMMTVREYIQLQDLTGGQMKKERVISESDDSSVQLVTSNMDESEEQQRQRRMHKVLKELSFKKPGPQLYAALPEQSESCHKMSSRATTSEMDDDFSTNIAHLAIRPKRNAKPSIHIVDDIDPDDDIQQYATPLMQHNAKGHLVYSGGSVDLCDCLDKACPGCNYPCRCGSTKCSYACRNNRRTCIESIESMDGEEVWNPYLLKADNNSD